MTGFYLFKAFGVGADWLVGNLCRKVIGKPVKTYKEIWNGDTKRDELDNQGYNLFYVVIGGVVLVGIIYILAKLLI